MTKVMAFFIPDSNELAQDRIRDKNNQFTKCLGFLFDNDQRDLNPHKYASSIVFERGAGIVDLYKLNKPVKK